MDLDFIYLSLMFLGAGLLGSFYFLCIPDKKEFKERLPNKPSVESVVLFLLICLMVWHIFSNYDGLQRAARVIALIIGLLLFETLFFILMKWIKQNWLNALISVVVVVSVFWLHFTIESFITFNTIIILATLGGTAYLIRSGLIKTWLVFILTALWMPYDFYFVTNVLPKFTKTTVTPYPFFAFPSVTVGNLSLGVGDFVFLALYTFVLVKDFNKKVAIIHAFLQGIGLLIAGYIVTVHDYTVPFLLILSPIFFAVYFIAYLINSRSKGK